MLFVYGTLQDPDILGAVLGRPVEAGTLRPASAPGYRAVAYPGRVYPALVELAGDKTPGLLVAGLGALDLEVLDAFEGAEYRREAIEVLVAGERVAADTYLPVIPIAATAPAWSLAAWTSEHKPAVLSTETGTARDLRRRLTGRVPG